jgi:hypothetical protein
MLMDAYACMHTCREGEIERFGEELESFDESRSLQQGGFMQLVV